LGGKVVSVTTDGFVCDIPNLETEIMDYYNNKNFNNIKSLAEEPITG